MKKALKQIVISLIISCITLMPFSIVKADNDFDQNITSFTAYQFFYDMYGLTGHTGEYGTLSCSTAASGYCSIYRIDTLASNPAYLFPIMSKSSGWNQYTSYNSSKKIRLTEEPLYIVFLSSTNFTTSNSTLYSAPNSQSTFTRVYNDIQTIHTPSGYAYIVLKLWATQIDPTNGYNFATLNLPGTASTNIIPMYYGTEILMPNDIHKLVFGYGIGQDVSDDITHELISNGTIDSQQAANNLDSSNQSLTTGLTDMSSAESQYNQDFNTQLNLIDFSDQLGNQQGFVSSAGFLVQTFNALIANNFLSVLIIIICILFVFKRFV